MKSDTDHPVRRGVGAGPQLPGGRSERRRCAPRPSPRWSHAVSWAWKRSRRA